MPLAKFPPATSPKKVIIPALDISTEIATNAPPFVPDATPLKVAGGINLAGNADPVILVVEAVAVPDQEVGINVTKLFSRKILIV